MVSNILNIALVAIVAGVTFAVLFVIIWFALAMAVKFYRIYLKRKTIEKIGGLTCANCGHKTSEK
jgi:hypothetical protein